MTVPEAPKHDYRMETECSARSLIARVLDLVRMVPDRAQRNEDALRDNPPRYYRLQQATALLAAFDIPTASGAPAPEIVEAISQVHRRVLDTESGALRGETATDYLRRFGPVELFAEGHFLLGRSPAELESAARRLQSSFPRGWPIPRSADDEDKRFTGNAVRIVWENMFRFRQVAESVVDFNGGVLEASGWHLYSVELTEAVCRRVLASLRELDDLMAYLVDPQQRVFSRAELIRRHGFPDVDLLEIDCEWA